MAHLGAAVFVVVSCQEVCNTSLYCYADGWRHVYCVELNESLAERLREEQLSAPVTATLGVALWRCDYNDAP